MEILEKQQYENARGYALRVINHNIINFELKPGELISENDISGLLGLSRTPVREALIELNKLGLVDIIPQKGSYVSKIDYDIIEESRFMREVLEKAVLKLLCADIAPDYLIKLKSNIDMQKLCVTDASYTNKLFELDNEFHRLMFEAANKTWTYNIIKSQMVHFDRLRILTIKSIKSNRTVEDHENILYAVERQDYELAEMLMSKHLHRHNVEKAELTTLYPAYFK